MANGFGSMFIGVAGLQSSQNALNVTSNNLANLDTTGYVRQSVLFADRDYVTFNTTAAISNQQSGLGVTIGDVVHSRDVFLDRLYRTESSRQSFYASTSEALTEVQNYYQELEGQAFQDALTDFWGSFQELYKYPEDSVYQNLVIQKAPLFTSRSSAVYSGLKSYQYNINSQISDDIDQVNELGKTISELNLQIQKVEAGNIETAMTLRDARDMALDELASLVDISYKEETNGVTLLGNQHTQYPNDYDPKVLETFVNKHPDHDYFVKFNCPEFTSLCPITGQPDFATLYISYVPDEIMVESKSLKLYLFSFRNHGDFHEDCVNIIMNDLIALMHPRYIEVWGKFLPRGGISIDPYCNYGMPGTKWEQVAWERLTHHDLYPETVRNR